MNPPEAASAAARLCAACGMCCNGVMFHTVHIKPGDSVRDLSTLGLKLKRKNGQRYLMQPCPAHRENQCAIYEGRPTRCRLFECQQLQRLAAGTITEATALAQIQEAQSLVREINEMLDRAGATNLKRPLSKRCEKALAEPLDPDSTDHQMIAIHARLPVALQELEDLLDVHFRLPSAHGAA